MHNKPFPFLLRTVRLLQSCHYLLGARMPSLLRNYSSRTGLLLLHEIKPWTPPSIATYIPIRFLHEENSIKAVSVNSAPSSSDQDHVSVHNDDSLEPDTGLDVGNPRLQSTSTGPPKKSSCVEVLDAFSGNSHSTHELYCGIMDLWNILAYKNKFKLSDMQLISEHPNFFNICYEVMKSAPSMPNKFLVCSLWVFGSLKVNQKTRLIQTLLNVCQQRLSTFKVEEISVLAKCLKMMESDKNVDVLNSGLCLLLELKCEAIKDVATLQNLMRIAPAHIIPKFEEKALQMIDKFTVSQCFIMFSVLAEINLHSKSLLDSCSDRLIDCLDELSCKRIVRLTDCCITLLYCNEKLLSAVGDNIMNNVYMWDTWQISMVLRSMAFLYFRHVPLLDYFADKLMQDSESLRINNLVIAAKVFSLVNHLPEGKGDKFLETLNTVLDLYINSMKKKELLKTVYNLCLLGLVSRSAINRLLEDKCFLSTMDNVEKSYLSHIKLCLLLEMGSSPFSIQDLKKVPSNHSPSVMMCHTFLQNYFKNPTLYQENVQFPQSYFIDFVFTLDREKSKLVPTEDMQNFENDDNITRIAVLCCTANAFALGSLHPVGKIALKIRHLKSFGFTVVVVPVNQFIMLTEAKKVEFLRENIFKKISSQ
ncbi:FAST kinase domain-containing protein 2, mitochondrial [Rhinoderma darwinii]|uniref:FAST kinase domain-containing protein 2, mitochondrial n=1 Tax=Rhinoderma darwinii TaxID=43563 RepID=UPI003F67FB06